MRLSIIVAVWLACVVMVTGQVYNEMVMDMESGEDILWGPVTWDGLREEAPFSEWFEKEYTSYEPDMEVIGVLDTETLSTWFVRIVMGTWCPDSQRELPRFYKIWETLGLDFETISLYGLDSQKMGPDMSIDSLAIEKVPTFIFYQCNMELGRVVESPEESLEKALFTLLYEF